MANDTTKPSVKSFIIVYGEWFYRIIVVIGFAAVLWLNQNYATKHEFSEEITSLKNDLGKMSQQINNRIDTLVTSVNTANTAIAVTQQRQEEIADLKLRLRDLERSHLIREQRDPK